MDIYRDYKNINFNKPHVVAVGVFDGIHRGHQKILKKTIAKGRKLNHKTVVVTFETKGSDKLTIPQEKERLLGEFPIDAVVEFSAGEDWMNWEPDEFINTFLKGSLNCTSLVVGKDFKFGKDRKGDIELLKKSDLNLYPVGLLKYRGEKISSTAIRKALSASDVKKAKKYLGRPYSFTGTKIKGRGIGKELGFPTVNLEVDREKLLPEGVFKVLAKVKKDNDILKLPGAAFIGPVRTEKIKPKERTVEIHFPSYEKGIDIKKVDFVKFIRKAKKFKSKSALAAQIKEDLKEID